MYDALSDKQFIETAKQQMNYLMSHRGVSKKDIFVYVQGVEGEWVQR